MRKPVEAGDGSYAGAVLAAFDEQEAASSVPAWLAATDRLNSWVRSKSFRGGAFSNGTLRRRIYEIKGEALRRAHNELACTHRRLETIVTCRDCNGSGKYTDWNDYEWPHCRACDSTGNVRLRFVESRVIFDSSRGDAFVWHSPALRFPLPDHVIAGEASAFGDDGDVWTVNQPGRDMTPDEAARDLLVCDAAFPMRRRGWCEEQACRSCDCTRRYALYLGRAVGNCAHCATEIAPGVTVNRCGKTIGRVEFTFAVCDGCYALRKNSLDLFNVAVPTDLMTPNVAEWVRVNDALADRSRA